MTLQEHPPTHPPTRAVAYLEAGLPSDEWLLDLERFSLPLLPACSDLQLGNLSWALRRLEVMPGRPWLQAFAAAAGGLLARRAYRRVPLAMTLHGMAAWGAAAPSGEAWWDGFEGAARARLQQLKVDHGRRQAQAWRGGALRDGGGAGSSKGAAGGGEAGGGGGGDDELADTETGAALQEEQAEWAAAAAETAAAAAAAGAAGAAWEQLEAQPRRRAGQQRGRRAARPGGGAGSQDADADAAGEKAAEGPAPAAGGAAAARPPIRAAALVRPRRPFGGASQQGGGGGRGAADAGRQGSTGGQRLLSEH